MVGSGSFWCWLVTCIMHARVVVMYHALQLEYCLVVQSLAITLHESKYGGEYSLIDVV